MKPAILFDLGNTFAAASVKRRPEDCMFVGDDLSWDIAGSEAAGMRPVLMDRDRRHHDYAGERVEDLVGLAAIVE